MLKRNAKINGVLLQQVVQKLSERKQQWIECHGGYLE
jgi:hypothetical protein